MEIQLNFRSFQEVDAECFLYVHCCLGPTNDLVQVLIQPSDSLRKA